MRVRNHRLVLTTAVVGAAALTLGLSSTAHADTGARSGDVVGVGSDTLQNGADFVLDASANGAVGGYNTLGNLNRVFNVDATGDANGRATYDGTCGAATSPATLCTSSNAGAPNGLAGTVVLRGGSNPVIRPNGSGNGVKALIADTVNSSGSTQFGGYGGLASGSIQYARMSRLPNTGEVGLCSTDSACGGLHVFQFATDDLQIAHLGTGSNAPAGGLSAQDLIHIYQCDPGYTTWDKFGGSSTDTIDPLLPQSGSGTRNFFLADLQAANKNTAITLGPCVRTVQEHDPDGIYTAPKPADAIEPFSVGKLKLINAGYFNQGGAAFAKNYLASFPAGQTADGNTAATYSSTRGLFIAIRQTDLTSTVPFQPGSALNWAQTLFAGSNDGTYVPWIARSENAALIQAAGFTPAYINCSQLNPTTTCTP